MMGIISPGATAAVFSQKRLLSTSCNKQGQRSSYSIFFMVLFPMLFEVRRIVCVEN